MTPAETDDWLTATLTAHGGAADIATVRAAAESVGIPFRRVERARSRLGIITDRSGFRQVTTLWRMPASAAVTERRNRGDDGGDGRDGAEAAVADGNGALDLLSVLAQLQGALRDRASLTPGEYRLVRELRLLLLSPDLDQRLAAIERTQVRLTREQVRVMREVVLVALERLGGIARDDDRIGRELPGIVREVAGRDKP